MKKYVSDLLVKSVEFLRADYFLMKLTAADGQPLPEMRPGQFVEVKVEQSGTTFLRRPISINYVDRTRGELWLLVHIVGDGTAALSKKQAGDTVNLMFPLGNGFSLDYAPGAKILLVGGGVGTAPLLYYGEQLRQKGCEPTFLLGGRSAKDLLQLEEFRKIGRTFVTTEDGSAGEKGFVTNLRKFDLINMIHLGARAFRCHSHVRSETYDDGRGTLRIFPRHALRGFAREPHGMRHRGLPLLCGEKERRAQCLRL